MSFLIAAVAGFTSGIFARSLLFSDWAPAAFIGLVTLLCAASYVLKPRRAYLLCALFCLFALLGIARMMMSESPLPETFASQISARVHYEGVVVADPDLRDASQRIRIRITEGDVETIVLAVAPRTAKASVGDRVRLSGTLALPEAFETEGGRIFRYDKYLEARGVRFILEYASVSVLEEASPYAIPAAFARLKHAFLDGLAKALPEPYAALSGGIVIGGKTGLGEELQDAFIRSGLVQIVVLSGYNVMIIAELLLAALALTALPNKWSAALAAFAILLFVGIAGASATALRAACMALIALYARATGRTYAAGRALLFVIFLMLLWNPLYLAFDPGFGLSVAATAGLIWLSPRIETHLLFLGAFWRNAVATTLAAQAAVLPLLLYETGTLSLVAIPANLIVLPFIPLAMAFSAIAGIAGIIFDGLAPLVGMPAYALATYVIFVAREAAALPLSAVTLPAFPFWLVLAAYSALVFAASSKRFSMTPQLRLAKKAST